MLPTHLLRLPPAHPAPVRLLAAALAVLALLLSALPGAAQPARCATPAHRAFDFWVGTWEVHTPDGRVAGQNTIERKLGGCVVHERYTTPAGYEGESLNIFDASRGVWHQTWTDNGGLLLLLEGGREDGAMVMEGQTVDAAGTVTRQRITWSRVDGDPDRVRQHWESSTDDGQSWTTAFDGLYVRQPAEGG